jgi:hypothetical protein
MMYYGLLTPTGNFVAKLKYDGEQHGMQVHQYTFGTLDDQEVFKGEFLLDRPDFYQPEGKGVLMALLQYLFGAGSRVNQFVDEMTEEQLYIYNHVSLIELRFALLSTKGDKIEEKA